LVDRDIKCWRKSAVNIVHSPGPVIIYYRGGFHHVTPSVPEKSAASAHGIDQVDDLAIIPGVGLCIPDDLGADVVPGLCLPSTMTVGWATNGLRVLRVTRRSRNCLLFLVLTSGLTE
jgi:hypothetical protein